jgi:hypothetical protein
MKLLAHLFSSRGMLAACAIAYVLLLSLALLACAPGTGGTGTGPITASSDPSNPGTPSTGTGAPTPQPNPAAPGTPATPSPPPSSAAPLFSSTGLANNSALAFSGAVDSSSGFALGSTASSIDGSAPAPILTVGNLSSLPACGTATAGLSSTSTLNLSATGIRYQQDCYVFNYTGSWNFGASLTVLDVQGQLTTTSQPTPAAVPARLLLFTNEPLNSPSVRLQALLLDPNRKEQLPPQVLSKAGL